MSPYREKQGTGAIASRIGVRALGICIAAVGSTGIAGCCACARGDQAYIGVAASRAGDVSSVVASGPACDTVQCVAPGGSHGGACDGYSVHLVAEGPCRVTFSFTSGATPVVFDLQIAHTSPLQCCQGLYPQGLTAQLQVPDLADAGRGD